MKSRVVDSVCCMSPCCNRIGEVALAMLYLSDRGLSQIEAGGYNLATVS